MASPSNGASRTELAVTLTNVTTTDDLSRIDDHLRQGMEAELVTAREELSKAAAHASSVESELFAVAARLTAKEAEHEAAIAALAKLRDELFDARTALEESQAQTAEANGRIAALEKRITNFENQRSFTERAVRKVVRSVKR